MQISNLFKPTHSIAALRMLVGAIFILHASARIYNNTLPEFESFLNKSGFPFGYYLAWLVTLFEIIGGIAMFFRFLVKLFCIGEAIILFTGILVVHWQNSWFIESMSLNGFEYSIVMISILIAIFAAERKAERNITPLL